MHALLAVLTQRLRSNTTPTCIPQSLSAPPLPRSSTAACSPPLPRRPPRPSQLTGLSDPVYAEAVVTVHQYDIVLDVTVTNR